MCKKVVLVLVGLGMVLTGFSQYVIRGKVSTQKLVPVEGASIAVKNSYLGAVTASDGTFSFEVADTGLMVLIVSAIGYKTYENEILVHVFNNTVNIRLKEEISELQAVVISAGTFEASDKKRATVLKSVDIVTTAGEQADLVATLKTLPGAQQVGEQEGLFIRGGSGAETRVFMDGIAVNNPFFSSVPGISQRSRFSPLLFKGTVFSSGGYSAQYGQALSSVLLLETLDLPSRSELNMIISTPQLSFMGQRLNKARTGSMGLTVNYNNLKPYFSVIKQRVNYAKAPEVLNGEFHARQKMKRGMLKLYAYVNTNVVAFNRKNLDYPLSPENFYLKNENIFTTATYSGKLSDSWNLYAGLAYSYNKDSIRQFNGINDSAFNVFTPQLENSTLQGRFTLTKKFTGLTKLYSGVEYLHTKDKVFAKDSIPRIKVGDDYIALYAEADIYYTSKLVSRIGIRTEYSPLLKRSVISPRISLAYKLTDRSQVSFAFGNFYQKPEIFYLFRNKELDFTKSTHYIMNFQRVTVAQTLRMELFQKDYQRLISYPSTDLTAISNDGDGYARGIELFWRDKKSIKHLDYWISYSFLDTKRKYLDYPYSVQPPFVARHTASLVLKRFVTALSTQFSATYNFASGRPYYHPGSKSGDFMKDKTINYHNTGFQVNYLVTFKKTNAVFILNMNNVLGNKQIFSYRFSKEPVNSEYAMEAVTPTSKRFIFLGVYLSIGADRRKTILD